MLKILWWILVAQIKLYQNRNRLWRDKQNQTLFVWRIIFYFCKRASSVAETYALVWSFVEIRHLYWIDRNKIRSSQEANDSLRGQKKKYFFFADFRLVFFKVYLKKKYQHEFNVLDTLLPLFMCNLSKFWRCISGIWGKRSWICNWKYFGKIWNPQKWH